MTSTHNVQLENVYPLRISPQNAAMYSPDQEVVFTLALNDQDKQDVLSLRRLAYATANKIPSQVPSEELSDAYDNRAFIVLGRLGGLTVATLRMVYCETESDILEHDSFFSREPGWPGKQDLLEISRLCVHPDFRGTDLVLGMFRQIALIMSQLQKRWITGSATKKNLQLYLNVGCQQTGVEYHHHVLGGEKHHVFLADVYSVVLEGQKINPWIWGLCFQRDYQLLKMNYRAKLALATQCRMALYRIITPTCKLFLWYWEKKRKNKRIRITNAASHAH